MVHESMKKAVVTGGAGFIGGHITDALLTEGYEVHVIDTLVASSRERVPAQATLHEIDILDTEAIAPVLAGADVVFHEAALPRVPFSIDHPKEAHAANVDGTFSVLLAANEGNVGRVVYAASASAYGDQQELPLREGMPSAPVNPYGLQKYIGEQYARMFSLVYGLPTVSLRYFNVYGPRMDPSGPYGLAIAKFIDQKQQDKALTIVGDGEQTRDFTHVRDIVRANLLAATSASVGNGEVINIGGGKETSVNELAQLIDPDGTREFLPARQEARRSRADISRAQELLGWTPEVTLAEGVAELLA